MAGGPGPAAPRAPPCLEINGPGEGPARKGREGRQGRAGQGRADGGSGRRGAAQPGPARPAGARPLPARLAAAGGGGTPGGAGRRPQHAAEGPGPAATPWAGGTGPSRRGASAPRPPPPSGVPPPPASPASSSFSCCQRGDSARLSGSGVPPPAEGGRAALPRAPRRGSAPGAAVAPRGACRSRGPGSIRLPFPPPPRRRLPAPPPRCHGHGVAAGRCLLRSCLRTLCEVRAEGRDGAGRGGRARRGRAGARRGEGGHGRAGPGRAGAGPAAGRAGRRGGRAVLGPGGSGARRFSRSPARPPSCRPVLPCPLRGSRRSPARTCCALSRPAARPGGSRCLGGQSLSGGRAGAAEPGLRRQRAARPAGGCWTLLSSGAPTT